MGAICGRFRAEVLEVDVAIGVTRDRHHLEAAHGGGRGVGAVGAGGDEADVAVALVTRLVVAADREQAGVFTLGAGVGLQRHGGEAGDFRQPSLQVAEKPLVTAGLGGRGKRMQARELGPRHREHLAGRIQFHGARTERDHRVAERKILRLEPADIAQHLVLGVVAVERRMRQEAGCTGDRGRERGGPGVGRGEAGLERLGGGRAEEREQQLHLLERGGFVERDPDCVLVDGAHVDLLRLGGRVYPGRGYAADGQRIEHRLGVYLCSRGPKPGGQDRGQQFHALRDSPQALRTVVDGVHRGHDGEQDLSGADVRRGLVAADVLLAGAEGEAHRRIALGILGNTNEPARHLTLEGVLGGEEAGMRTPEAHRHAEALGGADRDIGAELSRRAQQGEGEQVRRDDGIRARCVGGGEERLEVMDRTRGIRVLHEDPEAGRVRLKGAVIADDDFDAEGFRPGFHDVNRLGVTLLGDEERAVRSGITFLQAVAHHHRLGGGGAFVEHRGVRNLERSEIGDEGLEIEQRLEAALRDFRLVRGVGGVPAGILEDVALNHRGRERLVVTEPDETAVDTIVRRHGAEFGQRCVLADGSGQLQGATPNLRRHRGVGQRIDRAEAQQLEHRGRVGGVVTVVAAGERVGGREQITKRGH